MPLIVRWPGVAAPGSQNRDLVQNLDFAETFLEMAGVEVPDDMQGRSIVPLLGGRTPSDWRKSVYYHYYEFPSVHSVRRHCGVRTDRYKLIHYYGIGEWELFDLQKDPREMRSVYQQADYADVVKELKAELARLRKLYKVDQYQEPPTPPAPGKVPLELVLRWDFAHADEEQIEDVTGHGYHARASNAQLDQGRQGVALLLEDSAFAVVKQVPKGFDPAWKPLALGAWCKTDSADGVVMACGGKAFGFSLYLQDGRPHFALQSAGVPVRAVGRRKVPRGQWFHLAGRLDADGRLHVLIDGRPSGRSQARQLISRRHRQLTEISLGTDTGDPVAEYGKDTARFTGLLEDVRLYWGTLDEDALKKWIGE